MINFVKNKPSSTTSASTPNVKVAPTTTPSTLPLDEQLIEQARPSELNSNSDLDFSQRHLLVNQETVEAKDNYKTVLNFARNLYNTLIPQERSGISTAEILKGTRATRERVRSFIIEKVISELEKRAKAGDLPLLTTKEYETIVDDLMDYQFGLGPIDALCRKPGVEDVCVNSYPSSDGVKLIAFVISRYGKSIHPLDISVDELLELVRRQLARDGKNITPVTPRQDGTTMDGRRINVVVPPLVDPGITLTIRIPSLSVASLHQFVERGTLTPAAASFLALAVRAQMSIIIAGSTGAGKTSLLNALTGAINPTYRVVTIEDTRELNVRVPDHVYMVTGYQSLDNQNGRTYSMRDLVANALRQRPNHIILGEVRGAEAWEAVKATNTGHRGTMMTIHSDDSEGVFNRLVTLCREAPEATKLDDVTLMKNVVAAFRFIVYLKAIHLGGSETLRIVQTISECTGLGETGVSINPIFAYNWKTKTLDRTVYQLSNAAYDLFEQAGFSKTFVNEVLQGKVEFYRQTEDELEKYLETFSSLLRKDTP